MMNPIHTFRFKKNDSIWSSVKDKECEISGWEFRTENSLSVHHNLTWDVYTSEQFEQEVLGLIKAKHPNVKDISFSEQGLQEDGIADMDVVYDDEK